MELASQLSLLAESRGVTAPHDAETMVVGFWSAGERIVEVNGRMLPANVWFHFAADGTAVLSVRYRDQDRASATFGRWSISDESLLVTEFGKTVIGAPLAIQDEVGDIVAWAGEVLFRLPQDLPTDGPMAGSLTAPGLGELSPSPGHVLCVGVPPAAPASTVDPRPPAGE